MKKISTVIIFLLVLVISSVGAFASTIPVYKDGSRIKNDAIWTYEQNGEVYFGDTYTDVKYVFPEETANASFPSEYGNKSLVRKWADMYEYAYRFINGEVYLDKIPSTPNTPSTSTPTIYYIPIEVFYNDTKVVFSDQPPVIMNDRTLVPIRFVVEAMGWEVDWDEEAQNVIISNKYNQMGLFINQPYYFFNGKKKDMDVSPIIIGDRTMVPIRFVAEAFGKQVDWDDSQEVKKVLITNKVIIVK